MLKPSRPKSPSQFEGIYDRIIPEDHFLRKFNNLVDLSFIYDELKDKYCKRKINQCIEKAPDLCYPFFISLRL